MVYSSSHIWAQYKESDALYYLKRQGLFMKENKNWKKQIALFLISQNLSMFGSSVVGFSIVWYITVTTESGFWITLSTLATLIPQVLVSLWAGVFADR